MNRSITYLCLFLTFLFSFNGRGDAATCTSSFQNYQNYNHGYCPDCDCAPCRGDCASCDTPCDPCGAVCDPCAPACEDPCGDECDADPCAPICGAECGISICAIGVAIAAVIAAAAIIIASGNGSSSHE